MNNIDQTRVARLLPEKSDDTAIKEELSKVNYFI
jgi:hypothetical protein